MLPGLHRGIRPQHLRSLLRLDQDEQRRLHKLPAPEGMLFNQHVPGPFPRLLGFEVVGSSSSFRGIQLLFARTQGQLQLGSNVRLAQQRPATSSIALVALTNVVLITIQPCRRDLAKHDESSPEDAVALTPGLEVRKTIDLHWDNLALRVQPNASQPYLLGFLAKP